ncbi:MAG TPA: transglutaminaseTgpA domain-containing protein, partial [Gaiellaceae bacterium]|nr:transglutaminaseTgpA domain-containing protein [Gaiellaceae bacterium]
MARTLGVAALPAMLIALFWLRLEGRPIAGAEWIWVVVLALAPALAPILWLRLALMVPASLVALWVALDLRAADDRPGFFEPVFLRFDDGFFDYYDHSLPFNGAEQPHMHGVLVLAIFAFCLAFAQFAAARRPLPAVLTLVAGAGWPATLLSTDTTFYGAVILAAALGVLAGLRTARPLPALVAGTVLVLAAAGVSTSAAVAKDGLLAWESWDPNGPSRQVSVRYVWDGKYDGIQFPKESTTVLRIVGPKRGLYWRATTLDEFDADRWLENPTPLSTGLARGRLPSDPLLPARSLNPRTWVEQQVEVFALRDAHVVAAAQPVALQAPQLGGVFNLSDGIVRVYGGLRRGQRY